MLVRVETLTPKTAEMMLGRNYASNRNLRSSKVATYADDMRAGRWKLTGSTIQITDAGVLIDGQHRLKAVIDSGIAVDFLVARGVPSDAFDHIDIGMSRKANDVIKSRGKAIGKSEIGAARLMYFGPRTATHANPSQVFVADLAETYGGLISQVAPKTNMRGIATSPVYAALALATFYESMHEVLSFSSILTDGISSAQRDRTVVALRDWLLNTPRPSQEESFLKTCHAIRSFCSGRVLTRIMYPSAPAYTPIADNKSLA